MRRLHLVLSCALIAAVAACGGGKSGSSKAPALPVLPVLSTIPAILNATPTSAGSPAFAVLSATAYITSSDDFEIHGEVMNNSGKTAGEITVHVLLFDRNGKPVVTSTSETSATRDVTPAGEKTPFYLAFPNAKKLTATVASYQLTADGAATDMRPVQGLGISHELVVRTPQGDYTLTGHVTNTGDTPIKSPSVIATFYDAAGKVLRTQQQVFSADAFAPGQGEDFSFTIGGGAAGIVRYALVTQGEQ